MEDRIPVITGCTASGKTAVALELADRVSSSVEIICADSRQLYRGMNIGTAKPSTEQLLKVPHHMLDVADPDILLSAGWYAEEAMKAIETVLNRGAIPLVVGGSALYVMALAGLLDPLPARNNQLRDALISLESVLPGSLHRILTAFDEAQALTVDSNDRVRLVRALEIAFLSGRKPSELKSGGKPDRRFRFIFLERENSELRRRIRERTSLMLENGLVDEVKMLLEKGFSRNPVMGATIGYAEILDYLDGRCSLVEAQNRIENNTWKYARRQRNMFRRIPGMIRTGNTIEEVVAALFEEGGSREQG